MQVSRQYSRAPLTEAIIDLKVILPSDITISKLAEVEADVRNSFPNKEAIYTGTVLLQPDSTTPINATQQVNGFLFRSTDKTKVFQVTLNGFTFNRLSPYTSWEDFRNDAKQAWEIYRKACRPEVVIRAGIRFINRLDLPGPPLDLKEYLRIAPEVTPDLPKTQINSFFLQLQIPQEDCMLVVSEALVPPVQPGTVAIILDFDLFREQIWKSDDSALWEYLEKLRTLKNVAFEASITNKMRELIV